MLGLLVRKHRSAGFRYASHFAKHQVAEVLNKIDEEFKEGAEIEGFLVNKVAPVPEFNMTIVKLRHMHTGCDFLHLARDDDNNAFSICFRTTPLVSTGVSHVLEHCVLCGSVKYPCKDPFFKMMGRSMATFMNAMTGPDYTLYPFATQNKADYKNLMSVYLDAVFRPQLRETDFLQEGWRFEHEIPEDRGSPIVIKGVVFNEMKGVFSDNSAIFSNALLNNLLPSHTYGITAAGDPKSIPQLTFDDMKDFHKKYYHPSNCRIYSYGNYPLRNTLRFIDQEYLAEYPDTTDYAKATKVPAEPRWENEKKKHISCRPEPLSGSPEKQSTIAISTLCNDIRAVHETFMMQILGELLVNGNNSSFHKMLIEPNIGSGFAAVTGYDSQTRDSFFTVGLCSVDPCDFDKIVEIYHKTLDHVVENGFADNSIKAILHSIELLTKHQTSNFGLDMLFQITPTWNHDGDITKVIKMNDKIRSFKKNLAENPSSLQDLVHEHLKGNNHRLILTMSPDEEFDANEADAEKQSVEQRVNAFTQAKKDDVYEKYLEIRKDREIQQNSRCLPTLTVSDLVPDVERVSLKGFAVQNVPVQVCNVPSNGISYIRGVLNTSILSDEAKNLLPLFCIAATKMGSKDRNYMQMEQLIQLKTGRLSFGTHIAENIYDILSYEEGITFSSMCMDRNITAMMQLWTEIFTGATFKDLNRFRTVIKQTAETVTHDLTACGDLYAISVASAQISPPSSRKEQFGGLHFMQKMRELSSKVNLSDTIEMMAEIAKIVLKKNLIRIAINTSTEVEEKLLKAIDGFLKQVPGEYRNSCKITKPTVNYDPVNISLHFEMPVQVSYAAHCIRTVTYTHPDFPILRLAARLLTTKFCLPYIRENTGAYGAGANISTSGTLSLSSYRDPSPSATFDAFKKVKKWLEIGTEYSASDVEEAKLGVFQSIDSPVPAGSKGVRNFLFGISDDELQRHRKTIMAARKEDLMRVASLLDENYQARCLIGPRNDDITLRSEENWQKRYSQYN